MIISTGVNAKNQEECTFLTKNAVALKELLGEDIAEGVRQKAHVSNHHFMPRT